MAITLECTGCGGAMEVANEQAGQQIRCGRCATVLQVPDAELRMKAQ
jgi:phage FluMu protein Com